MDHEKVNISYTAMSCGVLQLSRISNEIVDVLYAIASFLYHPAKGTPAVFIVASDVDDRTTSTELLIESVRNRKFGSVRTSGPEENPKTGNMINVYVWQIDHAQFKEWYRAERVIRLGRVGR